MAYNLLERILSEYKSFDCFVSAPAGLVGPKASINSGIFRLEIKGAIGQTEVARRRKGVIRIRR
jgi:hypothetical protein